MNSNLNEMLGKFAEFLKTEAKTETVIGEQFQLGEYKCLPVIGVGLGLGVGGGEGNDPKKGEGGGAGGGAGMGMSPVGFLVTRGEMIQFIPASQSKGLTAAFEKIPELLDKYFEKDRSAKAGKTAAV